MKKGASVLISTFMFLWTGIHAQTPGEWTWMSGDNINSQPPVFGVQGVPDPLNKPGGIYEGCEWTDGAGNFWMFGGLDYNFGTQADLWKYDPSTNEWTWVNGPGGIAGNPVYGTKGVAASTNTPGGRGYGMISWIDNSGIFWMYGGYSNQNAVFLADFWKYDPGVNMWTWMGGDTLPNSIGSHGTMGVPSPLNYPPSSTENACSWVLGNELWFYGGMSNGPYIGDMWRYDISTTEWTWMVGDPTPGAAPVYGTLGVSDPANFPGSRMCYSKWMDLNNDFWIFGGSSGFGTNNDLWRYSPPTNQWTWMSGPNISNDQGSFGVQCTDASSNRPPARTEARACWTDECGIFWMFGGSSTSGMACDLWRYDMNTDIWTWVSGSTGTAPGVYGTKGVSDPANVPGSRQGSHAYIDDLGHLWLFGGFEQGGLMINDLWRYVPDQTCGGCAMIPVPIFSAPNHVCPGSCIDFTNNSIGATSYIWSFPGGNPSVSTDVNPTNICYNTPGAYQVSLIAINSNTSDTLTLNNYITVYPLPPPQGILQNGDTLFANQGAVGYQWYDDGVLIPGATNYYYVAPHSGNYSVIATDDNGCEVEAVIIDIIASVQNISSSEETWVMPNPFTGEIRVTLTGKLRMYDNIGQKVFEKEIKDIYQTIDLASFSKGIYFLQLENGDRVLQLKLVKM